MNFVHLHVHTQYSLLDGASRIKELVPRAAELGQPALAMTDHGSLGGAYGFYRECLKHKIKPIIGCEFYHSPDESTKAPVFWGHPDDKGKDVSGSGAYTHLTVLATGAVGLRNLFKLQARGHASNFYRKSRINFGLLEEYSDGLIVLSGCMGSAISTRLRLGQTHAAATLAMKFKRIFPGRFYVEVMSHGTEEDRKLNDRLLALAEVCSLPVVMTNDSHFTAPEDKDAHEALCCIKTGNTMAHGSFFRDAGEGFHLRSYDEMVRVQTLSGLPSEAISNTVVIADQVGDYSEVFDTVVKMPTSGAENPGQTLRNATWAGLARLGENRTLDHDDQLEYELDVITSLGYADYFIVLGEIAQWCRANGVRFNTRGSAAGSLVGYALGIHDLDPLDWKLVFERFLNPSRVSLPDIDFDVAADRRDDLLKFVAERFGYDNVAQVGTYGFIKAKRAIDDAARVLGRPTSVAKELKGRIPPPKFGRSFDLDWQYFADLEEEEEKETLADVDFDEVSDRDVVTLATRLEGTIRTEGIHAAGVVISPEPIYNLMPVRRPAGHAIWVTSFANPNTDPQIDNLGFVKYDFLGLRNLQVLNECVQLLRETSKQSSDILPREFNDSATFELLSSGNTLGIFQLDSPGMRGLLRKLRPRSIEDIAAVLALYRPGPMGVNAHLKYAAREHTVIHPELEEALAPITGETYGLIVYQEQVLQALKAVCGWDYAEADLIFNAMRKKLTAKLEASKPAYDAAGKSRGFSEAALSALWDTLLPFADYSFNRAHAASYAVVAYHTAYLKANYGPAYMAVLLGSVADDINRLPRYLEETGKMGIPILPPDINSSEEGFTLDGDSIRYGLGAIKGVGPQAIRAIRRGRPYVGLTDYLLRATGAASGSGVLTSLAQAGAFDSLGEPRGRLVGSIAELAKRGAYTLAGTARGEVPVLPVTLRPFGPSLSDEELQAAEKAALGVVVTQSPVSATLSRPMTENEWLLLKRVVETNPGTSRLTVSYSGMKLYTGSFNNKSSYKFKVLPLEIS